jgi:hypothetical protein
MLKLWSEVPGARAREVAADIATLLWVASWTMASHRLYGMLAGFAEAGRVLRNGGQNLETAGRQIGDTLGSIPVIGADVGDLVRFTFAFAARPFFAVGADLERFLLTTAALMSLFVLLTPLALWLHRYLPWRWDRLRRLRAARRAVHASASAQLDGSEMERLLASRALHRLPYEDLLKYSPDPFGDWTSGHYTRLARAELASVGLRPPRPPVLPLPRSKSG